MEDHSPEFQLFPLHSVKCTAWVAMSKHGIIGPFWLEDDTGRSQAVNKERYIAALNKYWALLGRRGRAVRASQWFEQDGAIGNAFETESVHFGMILSQNRSPARVSFADLSKTFSGQL